MVYIQAKYPVFIIQKFMVKRSTFIREWESEHLVDEEHRERHLPLLL